MRHFETGATRNDDADRIDLEGFLSPLVIKRFGEYMHQNRMQSDGKMRASDNWQKGIPHDQYIKSALRHFLEWWTWHRNWLPSKRSLLVEEALCGLMFNVMGYLHEQLKKNVMSALQSQIKPGGITIIKESDGMPIPPPNGTYDEVMARHEKGIT